ncbi:MAG: formate dehydrogenase subunit alpha [Candidatus Eisenbacteria bacterium]|nr:formate dehydrogenase subunit alpha [Candidatus Eisenbacteria bacterium]
MIQIDGKPVEAEGTLLDACRAAGAEVAAMCKDDRLSVGGHCRSCMVEVNGKLVAACSTPARDGAEVVTESERLQAYRRDLGELMLSECDPRGRVGRRLAAWGADGSRYGRAPRIDRRDTSHPFIHFDANACILCRRCIRACEEIQGQFVYAVEGRGANAHLAWGGGRFADSECVSCGACVTACPSGALTNADMERAEKVTRPGEAHVVRTTCGYCGVGCQMDVHVAGLQAAARVTHIEGAAGSPVNHGHLCVKGRFAHGFSRHPERLTTPLVRKNGELVPATWDEALGVIAEGFARHRGKVAGLSSSRCTNEENYLFQKLVRGAFGTNDVDCCARVCHGPSAAGMRIALGTGAATNSLADIERADFLLVTGSNTTEAHPVTGARIRQAALGGTPLVVIDPRAIELAELADVHLQLRPGTNVPLLNSIAHVLVEDRLVDEDFVAARTEGWEEFRAFIKTQSPEATEPVTGVAAAKVRQAARMLGRAKRPMLCHGLGVTEHLQGSEAVMLLVNLGLLRGAIGREGVGVNPLRGQNNVQGAADMGCQPDSTTGYGAVDDPAVRERFERVWGRPLPSNVGRRLPQMLADARSGVLKCLYVFGEDVVQTDPDTHRTRAALENLEMLVVQELFLSETAKLAHVVLPAASFLEKDGTFTNGERRIQRVREALPPLAGTRPDWRILCDLMAACGWAQPFQTPSDVMDEIARVNPAFAGVSYARLEGDGLQWPVPDAAHPGTPILHAESFPRGRGKLSCVDFVKSPELRDGLTLVTGRLLEHYNCGTMTRRSGLDELVADDVLEMHAADATRRGIADGDVVMVTSDHGAIPLRARVSDRIAPGTLFTTFHFPGTRTNELVGEVRDRLSDCPEYKVVAVEVVKHTA